MLRRITVLIGVLIVLVANPAAVGAGGGGCHGPVTDAAGTTVEMSQFCMSPTILRIAEGDAVTWVNNDRAEHNAYSPALPGFGVDNLGFGESGTVTFAETGVYPYVCTLHPGMVGAVIVGDSDTPPPPASTTATKIELGEATLGHPAATPSPEIESRLAAIEASLVALPEPVEPASWPPLAVGLVAGVALAVVASRLRLLS